MLLCTLLGTVEALPRLRRKHNYHNAALLAVADTDAERMSSEAFVHFLCAQSVRAWDLAVHLHDGAGVHVGARAHR